MDVLAGLVFTVFAAVIFFTVLGKLLAPKAPEPEEEAESAKTRRSEPTPTDVDRFLAEINRRRREGERQPSPPPPPPRPEPRRESRRDPERRQRPAVVTTRRASEEEARRLPVAQAVDVVEVLPEVEPATAAKFQATRIVARSTSPILTEVASLLRSPRSIGAAIVLQEVLGPPLCRRRRVPGSPIRPLGQP
jgi:hypothetical protein